MWQGVDDAYPTDHHVDPCTDDTDRTRSDRGVDPCTDGTDRTISGYNALTNTGHAHDNMTTTRTTQPRPVDRLNVQIIQIL